MLLGVSKKGQEDVSKKYWTGIVLLIWIKCPDSVPRLETGLFWENTCHMKHIEIGFVCLFLFQCRTKIHFKDMKLYKIGQNYFFL